MKNYVEIVQNLNERIFSSQIVLPYSVEFGYSTNGYIHVIEVNQHRLWSSEEDDRDFYETHFPNGEACKIGGEYEDLEKYVWKEFVKYVQQLNTLI